MHRALLRDLHNALSHEEQCSGALEVQSNVRLGSRNLPVRFISQAAPRLRDCLAAS